jgi:hypothetical protein
MARKRNIIFFCCLILVIGSLSCSEEETPAPFTYTKIFTGENSKTWRISRVVLREEGKADDEISMETCERDDRYVFYNNDERLFEVTNGQSVCDSDEPHILVEYVWAFSNATATLNMVIPHFFGNFIIPFIVRDVTKKEMELEIFLDEDSTISYVFYFESTEEN